MGRHERGGAEIGQIDAPVFASPKSAVFLAAFRVNPVPVECPGEPCASGVRYGLLGGFPLLGERGDFLP